jgi:hypothetical protein
VRIGLFLRGDEGLQIGVLLVAARQYENHVVHRQLRRDPADVVCRRGERMRAGSDALELHRAYPTGDARLRWHLGESPRRGDKQH